MKEETLTLRSSIDPQLSRSALFRGMSFAALGATILFYTGTQWTLEQLSHWGWLALALSLVLITLGLYPYRKLTQLELKPYELAISRDAVVFSQKGTDFFQVPLELLCQVRHYQKGAVYGISAQIISPSPLRIRVLEKHFDMAAYLKRNQKRIGAELFFPFFSARSANELAECVDQSPD